MLLLVVYYEIKDNFTFFDGKMRCEELQKCIVFYHALISNMFTNKKELSNSFLMIIMKWKQIGNRKSASQNNICNRNKITAKKI